MSTCVITLSGIGANCETSVGGIRKIWLAEQSKVSVGAPSSSTETWGKKVTMASGSYFKQYYVRRGASSMTSTLTIDDANGISYVSTDLVLTFARMDHEKLTELEEITTKAADLAVLVEDANGNKWVLGGSDENAVLRSAATGQTGQAMGDANNYSITLNAVEAHWPYPINMTDEEWNALFSSTAE